MMFNKEMEDSKHFEINSCIVLNDLNSIIAQPPKADKGKTKMVEEKKGATNRKRSNTGDKAKSEPVKKPRVMKRSPKKSVSSSTTCMAEVGEGQPRPSP